MKTNKNKKNKVEKEYIPATLANLGKYAVVSDETKDLFNRFIRVLGKFYFTMSCVDVDSRALGVFYKITEFPFSNGTTEFFTYELIGDDKKIIKALRNLEKYKLIEVIKIEKMESGTFIKLQLIGTLRSSFDKIFKE